jgi:hypothetical protein
MRFLMDTLELPVPPSLGNPELIAWRERNWGRLGEIEKDGEHVEDLTGQHGWKVCQFVREGRLFDSNGQPLKESEFCTARPVRGEKYCTAHLPRQANKFLWLALGAAVMFILMRLL